MYNPGNVRVDGYIDTDKVDWTRGYYDDCEILDKGMLLISGQEATAQLEYDAALTAASESIDAPLNARFALSSLYQVTGDVETVEDQARAYQVEYSGLLVSDAIDFWLPTLLQSNGQIDEAIEAYQSLLAAAESASEIFAIELRIAYLEELIEETDTNGKMSTPQHDQWIHPRTSGK